MFRFAIIFNIEMIKIVPNLERFFIFLKFFSAENQNFNSEISQIINKVYNAIKNNIKKKLVVNFFIYTFAPEK